MDPPESIEFIIKDQPDKLAIISQGIKIWKNELMRSKGKPLTPLVEWLRCYLFASFAI